MEEKFGAIELAFTGAFIIGFWSYLHFRDGILALLIAGTVFIAFSLARPIGQLVTGVGRRIAACLRKKT